MNVETLVNVGLGRPVTDKYLTVAGAVAEPVTLRVPVGVSLAELIAAAGGATEPNVAVLVGGVMMGRLERNHDEPVDKTTGGVIVLPATHPVVRRHAAPDWRRSSASAAPPATSAASARSCARATCWAIRSSRTGRCGAWSSPGARPDDRGTLFCCECNLCTMFSCPEDLDPKNVCVTAKPAAREKGLFFAGRPEDLKPHPLAGQRRIPTRRLMAKLGIAGFRNVGPLEDRPLAPARVVLPLKQHAGEPARPVVRPGERVRAGDLVAAPAEGALGARIHASVAGTVRDVDGSVVIET